MEAHRLLAGQLNAVNRHLHDVFDRTEPDEPDAWLRRGAPGTNLPGFVFWHAARGLDFTVQAGIRGVPEVIEAEPWAAMPWARLGLGVGYSLAEADELAVLVDPTEVVAYADAVRSELSQWLRSASDEVLEAENHVLDNVRTLPAYNYPDNLKQTTWMQGMPVWVVISLSAFAHSWSHLDEVELLTRLGRIAGRG